MFVLYCVLDLSRNLELILFGGQTQCVVVDLGDDMPSPADVQLAHTRLRSLCLGGEEFITPASTPSLKPNQQSTTLY